MDEFPNLLDHILSSSTEDYTGLYEVVWEINTRYPDTDVEKRQPAAKWAVETLLSRGWIDLYEYRDDTGGKSHYKQVDPRRNKEILAVAINWEPQCDRDVSYWIASSPEGDRKYFGKSGR